MTTPEREKNPHAVAMGRIRSARRAAASARNARLGGKPSVARLTVAEAQELGYALGKGTVPRGNDDREGAWYFWRIDELATRPGPGYTSRQDTLNALADTVVARADAYLEAIADPSAAPVELTWVRARHPEWLKSGRPGTD